MNNLMRDFSDSDYNKIIGMFKYQCKKYGMRYRLGKFNGECHVTVRTRYEEFSFDVESNLYVKQMYHRSITERGSHKQFTSDLPEPLTVNETFKYINKHTRTKYEGKKLYRKTNVDRKVENYQGIDKKSGGGVYNGRRSNNTYGRHSKQQRRYLK